MRTAILIVFALALSACGTPKSQLRQMTTMSICHLMVTNPNTEYHGGQQVLLERGEACTPRQYEYIYRAQQQHQQGMAALGAYGAALQANSYRQVAPTMQRPVTCTRVAQNSVQCY